MNPNTGVKPEDRSPDTSYPRSETNDRARELAARLCLGFRYHDRCNRDAAVDAFAFVDHHWFPHVTLSEATTTAEHYVDALWAKDALERHCRVDGDVCREQLSNADWGVVQQAFRARAAHTIEPVLDTAACIHYAEKLTEAWRHHKIGKDYWTPMQAAQLRQVRAALQDPSYPEKPSDGHAGFGPEPAYYALAVELHDMHTERRWQEAVAAMTLYFDSILRKQ